MKYRKLGKTGFTISEVSLGTWQLGARWGDPFDPGVAEATINRAIDLGINFIDTADVYSDGLSERYTAKTVKQRSEEVYVATKCGRRLAPHTADGYNDKNIRKFVDDNLKNMGLERIDLIQLHCPPTDVYYRPEVFGTLDRLVEEGKLLYYGVSVEKIEEALKAIEYPGVATVQIIYNIFRQRPAERFFEEAKKRNVGIIVRVPLASGLLTGKFSSSTHFEKDDHRFFNREGKSFDKGETFAGVPYEIGIDAVERLRPVFGKDKSLALYALKWVLMSDSVSCTIPGASRVEQVEQNVKASDLPDLTPEILTEARAVYEDTIMPYVHQRW
ncbi:MAG: aldo/keto reductase [Spirochaetes bacterium]|nr:aldo/keto reductase [Spirochaetota bacterium]